MPSRKRSEFVRRFVGPLLAGAGIVTFLYAILGFGGGEAVAVLGVVGMCVGASLAWTGSRIPPDPNGEAMFESTWDSRSDDR